MSRATFTSFSSLYSSRSSSISEPTAEWVFMMANSSSVKRPGLFRISSGMAILPMSCKLEAIVISEMSSVVSGY